MGNSTSGNPHDRPTVRHDLSLDGAISFSVAVCGQMKAGKSRFINAIRGIADKNAADYAPVGNYDATTDVKKYAFRDSNLSHIWLYDVPGSGRVSIYSEDYFKANKLVAFDCVLIFIEGRIREEDIQLAKIARDKGIPFKFILSKCDERIKRHQTDHAVDQGTAKKEFSKNTTAVTRKQLYEKGDLAMSQTDVFLISSEVIENPEEYRDYRIDEDYLLRYITTQVPLDVQRTAS
uniref:IRG-type G domain-containing protein n=1 Tax=Plectus sambesii TaxID=2011161 RepID=A0A914X2V9_9BILA